MRVVAHGIDLVLCARVAEVWRRHGDHFLARIFTDAERRYCLDAKNPEIRLAGRFAVKEAVLKALGTGWRGGIEWTDIETLPDPLGKPLVSLSGHTARLAATLGIGQILASISHAGDYAQASVIALADESH
ncbi:MAG: holo-ACP synthase [Planctomycetes bacterium]|nr:holo-ACP synthase [Planctomycetota bacterium]